MLLDGLFLEMDCCFFRGSDSYCYRLKDDLNVEEEESLELDGGVGDGCVRLVYLFCVLKWFVDVLLFEIDYCGSYVDIIIFISVIIWIMFISLISMMYNWMELVKVRRNYSFLEFFVDLVVYCRID